MASRSLGTLTVDLIAKIGGFTQGMSQAEREADKKTRTIKRKLDQSAKEIGDAWSGIGKVLAASFAGISVASITSQLIGVAKETANAAAEVSNFSKLANTSTQDFQRLAYGANTVGMSAEKLADILKDVQDKAGDFAQTGGGGMADFFENIAPKVGVTVEQFRRLSGPEALQLYVSSLEKANLSQQDMTFYMEAIASDSTQLLPLLHNNGKAWSDLGDEAQRYGSILSDETIRAAEAYREETRKLDASLAGLRVEIADELLPVLTEMNRSLADPSVQAGIGKTIDLLADMAAGVVDLGNEFFLGMQYADGFWDALFKYGTANPFKSPKEQLESLRKELAGAQKDAGNFTLFKTEKQKQNDADRVRSLEQQIGYWSEMQGREDAKALAALDALSREGLAPYDAGTSTRDFSPVKPPKGAKPKGGKSQSEKDADAAKNFLQSMHDQAFKAQERTAWEQLHYDIQAKGLKLSEKQLGEAQGLATLADLRTEEAKKLSAQLDEQNHLYQLQERLMSAQQRHQLEMLTYGMGDQAAQELRERIALQQQQQAELRQMQQKHGEELRSTEKEEEQKALQAKFESRYKQTQAALAEELRLFDEAAKQKQAREKDWLAGAKAGMDTYARDAGNAYEQSKQLAQSTFQGMEDALVDFATTGKLNFKSFAASVINDLIRIQMRAAMAGVLGNAMGSLGDMLGMSMGGTYGAKTQAGLDNLISSNGWSGGGYTGPGGKYDPAGIVHRGEGVLSQNDMSALGGPRAFEAFRASLHRGYANGGVVGAAATVAASTGGAGLEVHVHNNAGAQVEQRQRTGPDGKAILDIFISEAAAQVAGGYGPMGQAMRQREQMGR